jgi:glucans biosynthesis protein C
MNLPTVEGKIPETSAPFSKTSSIGRLFYIDNIRVYLTILVILHHMMIIYAGTGSFYYTEGKPEFITQALGAWFNSINQSFFMGLFLLISAYFVPGSYDRKGPVRFFTDRLIRLGIPLAVYSWIINPIFGYFVFVLPQNPGMPFFRYFPVEYFKTQSWIGNGPLWFVEVLLIFSLFYILWRVLKPSRPATEARVGSFPSSWAIALFALLLGLASFLVRLVFPMDKYNFGPLNLQFGFFAQYIALFIVGLIAFRRNWLVNLPDKIGQRGLLVGILMILAWLPLVFILGADKNIEVVKGGFLWQALVYALWEAFACVSLCITVIYLFRRYLSRRGRVAGFLVPNAYTAYIIHAPVITLMAIAIRGVTLYPLLKWALLAPFALLACFGLSALIRKIPFTNRVL